MSHAPTSSRDAAGAPDIDGAGIRVPRVVRVLVVDDSAFVRKVVREMLSRTAFIEVVGAARDGEEALKLVEELQPDIVTCDLVMPQLDGVGFVTRQMARAPLPILILTATPADASLAIEALNAGAVDVVQKPTALATEALFDIREEVVEKIKAAARAPHRNLGRNPAVGAPSAAPAAPRPPRPATKLNYDLVVLGLSTGGPQALRHLLPRLPADLPVPVAIVLHMPVGYTALMAEKLDELTPLKVAEAKDGMPLLPGTVTLAAAGRHLSVRRDRRGQLVAMTAVQPLTHLHRPSVDVLFQSAAEVLRERVLGVVLTGMGDDGREGAAWIKAQGGTVLTEAEQSCVIYGMPRAVEEAGLSDAAVPLSEIANAILERL